MVHAHWLLNVVTMQIGIPSAVLIRAIEPLEGLDFMKKNRAKNGKDLTNGPGKLSQALGIDKNFNGKSLQTDSIWIENNHVSIDKKDILSSARIGVDYAEEDAKLPYRFYLKKNKWVSK